jgi:hypothetical protein
MSDSPLSISHGCQRDEEDDRDESFSAEEFPVGATTE